MRCLLKRWALPGLLCAAVLAPEALAQEERPAKKEAASPAEKIRTQLRQPLKTEFNGQSLGSAVEHLRQKTNLPVSFDQITLLQRGVNPQEATGEVQVRATGEPAGEVLRKLLNNYNLGCVILEDVLLITTDDMATARQLRQRVNLDVRSTTLQKAARDLAHRYGLNVVIDPRQVKKAEGTIDLQVENVTLETGLRLLAELADLKAARVDNVILITDAARAEKLRKEEPITPNPGGPFVPPPVAMPGGVAPGFGGFGGVGRAVPGVATPALPPPVAIPDMPPPPAGAEPIRKQLPPRPPRPPIAPDVPVSSPPAAPTAPAPLQRPEPRLQSGAAPRGSTNRG